MAPLNCAKCGSKEAQCQYCGVRYCNLQCLIDDQPAHGLLCLPLADQPGLTVPYPNQGGNFIRGILFRPEAVCPEFVWIAARVGWHGNIRAADEAIVSYVGRNFRDLTFQRHPITGDDMNRHIRVYFQALRRGLQMNQSLNTAGLPHGIRLYGVVLAIGIQDGPVDLDVMGENPQAQRRHPVDLDMADLRIVIDSLLSHYGYM